MGVALHCLCLCPWGRSGGNACLVGITWGPWVPAKLCSQNSSQTYLAFSVLSPTLCLPMDCSPPGSSAIGDSPGKNTGMGCHALLQGIFLTPGIELISLGVSCIDKWFFTTNATLEATGYPEYLGFSTTLCSLGTQVFTKLVELWPPVSKRGTSNFRDQEAGVFRSLQKPSTNTWGVGELRFIMPEAQRS